MEQVKHTLRHSIEKEPIWKHPKVDHVATFTMAVFPDCHENPCKYEKIHGYVISQIILENPWLFSQIIHDLRYILRENLHC